MVRCGARKALASGWQVSRPGKSMAHAGEGTPVPMHRERPRVTRSRGCWANPEGSGVMVIVWLTGRRCGAGRRDRRKARARGHGAYRQSAATLAARWCDRAWRNAGAGSGEGTGVVTDMLWLRQRGQILRMVSQHATAQFAAEVGPQYTLSNWHFGTPDNFTDSGLSRTLFHVESGFIGTKLRNRHATLKQLRRSVIAAVAGRSVSAARSLSGFRSGRASIRSLAVRTVAHIPLPRAYGDRTGRGCDGHRRRQDDL